MRLYYMTFKTKKNRYFSIKGYGILRDVYLQQFFYIFTIFFDFGLLADLLGLVRNGGSAGVYGEIVANKRPFCYN